MAEGQRLPLPWPAQAACLGVDPAIFVPDGPGGNLNKAKSICATCAYTGEAGPCAQYAAETGSIGVWGGVVFSTRTEKNERDDILALTVITAIADTHRILVQIEDVRPQKVEVEAIRN